MKKLRNKLTIIYLAAMIITSALVVRRYSIDIREMNLEHCRAASDYMWKAAGYYNVYEKDVPYELVEKYGWKNMQRWPDIAYGAKAFQTPDGKVCFYETSYMYAMDKLTKEEAEADWYRMGYYANVTDNCGNILADNSSVCIARRNTDIIMNIKSDTEYLEDTKVVRICDTFSEDAWGKVNPGPWVTSVIRGTYDGDNIYPSEVRFIGKDNTVYKYEADLFDNYADYKDVSEWIDVGSSKVSWYIQTDLDKEAKRLLDSTMNYRNTEKVYKEMNGGNLFTSYVYERRTMGTYTINSAYVFHPVKDALTDYKWLLIGVNAMYLVVILTTVCICNNRARFEKK